MPQCTLDSFPRLHLHTHAHSYTLVKVSLVEVRHLMASSLCLGFEPPSALVSLAAQEVSEYRKIHSGFRVSLSKCQPLPCRTPSCVTLDKLLSLSVPHTGSLLNGD